jgi:hypothetical protein
MTIYFKNLFNLKLAAQKYCNQFNMLSSSSPDKPTLFQKKSFKLFSENFLDYKLN